MKYKVGDKVRVKTLEKLISKYGEDCGTYINTPYHCMNKEMQSKCGNIVTIAVVDAINMYYCIKEDDWSWTDEMFDGLAEETVSELDIYKKALELCSEQLHNERNSDCAETPKFNRKYVEYWVNKAKRQLAPILDEEERAYLSAVIRPFKKCRVRIRKGEYAGEEYISILIGLDITVLPYFKKGTMYKGMEAHKDYTLKELGLE